MKEETLEEATDRLAKKYGYDVEGQKVADFVDGVVRGAEWQAERMYSDEEVLEFANWCRIQDNKHPNRVITTQQLFEQFKNQNNEQ
jgi:hypothetical protein